MEKTYKQKFYYIPELMNIKRNSRYTRKGSVVAGKIEQSSKISLNMCFGKGKANWIDEKNWVTKKYNNTVNFLTKLTPIRDCFERTKSNSTKSFCTNGEKKTKV